MRSETYRTNGGLAMDSSCISRIPRRWFLAPAFLALVLGGVAFAAKPGTQRSNRNGTGPFVVPIQPVRVTAGLTIVTGTGPGSFAVPAPGPQPFGMPGPGFGSPFAPQATGSLTPRVTWTTSVDRCLVPVPEVDSRFIISPRITDDRMIVAPSVVGLPAGSRP